MPTFMKMLNNISRSQAVYRSGKIAAKDLQAGHYAFVLAIYSKPGCSQEELARELCINKSTVTRNINCLEERGYITRNPLPNDKRQFSIRPTEKLLAVLPDIRKVSKEWRELLSCDIPEDELNVFNSVLARMEARAREIIEKQEESK